MREALTSPIFKKQPYCFTDFRHLSPFLAVTSLEGHPGYVYRGDPATGCSSFAVSLIRKQIPSSNPYHRADGDYCVAGTVVDQPPHALRSASSAVGSPLV
jgi:hypothetical protein